MKLNCGGADFEPFMRKSKKRLVLKKLTCKYDQIGPQMRWLTVGDKDPTTVHFLVLITFPIKLL